MSEVRESLLSEQVESRADSPARKEDIAALQHSVLSKLKYSVGKDPMLAADRDWFVATALAVRDRIVDRWMASTRLTNAQRRKRVYYLSLEFLIGQLLMDALNNLGLTEPMHAALRELGVELDTLRGFEPDAALGNGGLGRLAACFMESMATLSVAAYGYGIRYNHGLFRQVIADGWQHEHPETWLACGNPWEFERSDAGCSVGFGGAATAEEAGETSGRHIWVPAERVDAVAYDIPVVGWRGRHVNTLRLWSARAPDPLRLDAFNRGDHVEALSTRARANAISQVLYPGDDTLAGQELRLRQEYFFSSASLQDLLKRHIQQHGDVRTLARHAAIQLNDTHPAIAVVELMRLLLDVHGLPWPEAWEITTSTFCYTNHTLLPEALESWPVPLIERLLPRHMQLIYQINALHLQELRAATHTDGQFLSSMSLIDESGARRVRMGPLAFLGSRKVNGVSNLHTGLMRQTVFRDWHRVFPDRIVNQTNGITFRRWLFQANPGLTALLVEAVGEQVLDDPAALQYLAASANDPSLHDRLAAIRRANKARLAELIAGRLQIKVDADALFDVHIKRIHEYKRQLLNILETIALYNAIRSQPDREWVPRVKIFAGKAAASYRRAKLVIKLINDVAAIINNDPALRGLLKVVFLEDYNVSLAEKIIPAADLSEQISTAGMEASGTGNMKLALNGALTIGTLDGANIEIRNFVGEDNIFIFGLTAEQVAERRRLGPSPRDTLAESPALQEVLHQVGSGVFSRSEPDRFRELIECLIGPDYFMVVADFMSYAATQRQVDARWLDRPSWWQGSVLNTANAAWFSADRTIRGYADEIWAVPIPEHAPGAG